MVGQYQGGHERVQDDERHGTKSKCVAREDKGRPIATFLGEKVRMRTVENYFSTKTLSAFCKLARRYGRRRIRAYQLKKIWTIMELSTTSNVRGYRASTTQRQCESIFNKASDV